MTERNLDSNLKQQAYSKWVKGQSTEALEKELRNLELRQMVLQNAGPTMDAQIEQQTAEEWSEEDLDQYIENYKAELEAAKTAEERKQIMEDYEGRSLDESTKQCVADQLSTEPENMAQSQTGIDQAETAPAWLAERVEVNLHIGVVQRELTVRRHQELIKGEAAPASATARQQSKIDPDVVKRRAIVKQNRKLETIRICRLFDLNAVPLALRGDDWEDFSSHTEPWTDAYNEKPISERRRRRIRVIISKDKKA